MQNIVRNITQNIVRLTIAYFSLALSIGLFLFFVLDLTSLAFLFVGIAILLFCSGVRKISEEPLQYGIVTWLGKPTKEIRLAGYAWLIPTFQGLILKDATARTIPVKTDKHMTVDGVYFSADLRITYKPDLRPDGHALRFIEIGEYEEIESILSSETVGAIRGYINTHTSRQVLLGTTRDIIKIILGQISTHPADEALAKLESPNDDCDIEGLGIIITRLSIEAPYESDESIRKARQENVLERQRNKARVTRAKGTVAADRVKQKELKNLSPKERRQREESIENERRSRNIEEGRGQEIRVSGGAGTIISVPPLSGNSGGKKKKNNDEGDN